MTRKWRYIFNAVALLSLLAFLATAFVWLPEDCSFLWASDGRCISVDTFENIGGRDGITVRRFSPWASGVPFQYCICSTEGGDLIPLTGDGEKIGPTARVWLDQNGQPARRWQTKGHWSAPLKVELLSQLTYGPIFGVTAIAPSLWIVLRFVSAMTARQRAWRLQQRGFAVLVEDERHHKG